MQHSIDMTSIPLKSTIIIEKFIRASLLRKLNLETIEFLNLKLQELNKQGIMKLEDRKCNFDVEIGVDMLLDYKTGKAENFILWSGDSDFAYPLKELLHNNKKVAVFSTSRKFSAEMNELKQDGLILFEIKKLKNFICYPREMDSIIGL